MNRLDRTKFWLRLAYFKPIFANDYSTTTSKFYSQTINLPKGDFPIKHGRDLELKIERKNIPFENLCLNKSEKTKDYVLHDGPPYANGDPHFGHAINRILKDILVKRKLLENYNVDYRPGWDCHGLPIELKALSESLLDSTNSPVVIRSSARQFALNAIKHQREAFQQWFLSADWTNSYQTFDVEYSIKELKAFYDLYKKGLIFRELMPVYWSPKTGTALAEAELKYVEDHNSLAAFIRYPILDLFGQSLNIDALIWTTTPWTLLANEAIAFSEHFDYCLARMESSSNFLLIARENVEAIQKLLPNRISEIISDKTINLKELKYRDPINGEVKSFLPSINISSTKGTGLVHIAPNHGYDDYKLVKQHMKNKLLKESIIDDHGNLKLNDQRISITNNNASKFVLENLLPQESVLFAHQYQHSYPYDWRSNTPVIICPSYQWFLDIDSIRDKCIDALENVKFFPELFRKEMIKQIQSRPNWCLSRQRKYGVPIPVFYDRKSLKPVLTDEIFEILINKFRLKSLDIWWEEEPFELLANSNIDATNLIKGEDIFDIWFDSGCSWLAVLSGSDKVSEVYLEGADQLRGWFQSSLIISVALRNKAPYRSIFIHGFALDRNGYKMSKSLGNVINPQDIINKKRTTKNGDCGVDGLRLWIARNASDHKDIHVNLDDFDGEILTVLNRFRNTYRFLLSYLSKYEESQFLLQDDQIYRMPILDKYILYRIMDYYQNVQNCYDEIRLNNLIELTIRHFNYEMASFYLTRIKDRLYCDDCQSDNFKSILTVFYYFYHTITYTLAPILPHLALECHEKYPLNQSKIIANHFQHQNIDEFVQKILFPEKDSLTSGVEFSNNFKFILSSIELINQWASTKHNIVQFDCHILIKNSRINKIIQLLQPLPEEQTCSDLVECIQAAQISYGYDDNYANQNYPDCLELFEELPSTNNDIIMDNHLNSSLEQNFEQEKNYLMKIFLRPTKNKKCARCRRFNIDSNNSSDICQRCINVLKL